MNQWVGHGGQICRWYRKEKWFSLCHASNCCKIIQWNGARNYSVKLCKKLFSQIVQEISALAESSKCEWGIKLQWILSTMCTMCTTVDISQAQDFLRNRCLTCCDNDDACCRCESKKDLNPQYLLLCLLPGISHGGHPETTYYNSDTVITWWQ